MDFLGNIFLGIRIFDWIVLLLLLTIVSSLSNIYRMMWDTSKKLKDLWEKLYWNEKIEEIQSRYESYDSSSYSDTDLDDEDESLSKKNGLTNLEYQLGDIENVPLKNSSVDLALLSQALHHANRPAKAVDEAYRILEDGGRIIIIDLLEHDFEKARELYADVWLGFSQNKLYQLLKDAGFKQIEINIVSKETEEPYFQTILASAVKG